MTSHGVMETLIFVLAVVVIGTTVARYHFTGLGLGNALIIATLATALIFQVGATHSWRVRAERMRDLWMTGEVDR